MNILITGATGFVGKNLLPILSAEKRYKIYALVRKEPEKFLKQLNIDFIKGDLFNLSNLKNLDKIDVVIHIAGLTKTIYSRNFYYINTRATANLLNFFKKKNLKQFILISSLAAFGPSDNNIPADELSRPAPVSHYGLSKLLAEKLIKKYGIPYTIIRPPAVFGPFDKDIYTYFKMVKNRVVFNAGDINRLYSLIYVKDLAEFILKTILNKKALNEDFFVAYDDFYKIKDIVGAIESVYGKKSFKINLPQIFANIIGLPMQLIYAFTNISPLINMDKLREINQKNWICSAEKAKTLLNFSPSCKFEDAIKETFLWYRENNYI
jgi:nucleoside-diphosphate-sugar epimerase